MLDLQLDKPGDPHWLAKPKRKPRTHWMTGRDTIACGVLRTVFYTRDLEQVTCPACKKEA